MALKNFNNVKVGDKLKIVGYSSGHGFSVGTEVTAVTGYTPSNPNYISCRGRNTSGTETTYGVIYSDVEEVVYNKKRLEEKLKEAEETVSKAQSDVTMIKEQIAYLEETKQEAFDPIVFKVHQTLRLVKDGTKTDLDQAVLIAQLIKSN
jgi:hypothetical protein